jgi:hypothetical protein
MQERQVQVLFFLAKIALIAIIAGGYVNTLSDILAKANISIYYLSTFNTDFILVPKDSVDEAIACLKQNLSITID